MKVKYTGIFDEVLIPATGQIAEAGKAIDVDDEVAKDLIKQKDAWEKVTTKKKES